MVVRRARFRNPGATSRIARPWDIEAGVFPAGQTWETDPQTNARRDGALRIRGMDVLQQTGRPDWVCPAARFPAAMMGASAAVISRMGAQASGARFDRPGMGERPVDFSFPGEVARVGGATGRGFAQERLLNRLELGGMRAARFDSLAAQMGYSRLSRRTPYGIMAYPCARCCESSFPGPHAPSPPVRAP